MQKPWAIEVMPVINRSEGMKFSCPICKKFIGGGKWLVTLRIYEEFKCICIDPPPKCCGYEWTVPYAFSIESEADDFAVQVEIRMGHAGNTAEYVLHDYLDQKNIVRMQ